MERVVNEPAGLGLALVAARRAAGLTQGEVATLAGIHRSYLSEIERGEVSAQVERLLRVVRRLGLELVVRPSAVGGGSTHDDDAGAP